MKDFVPSQLEILLLIIGSDGCSVSPQASVTIGNEKPSAVAAVSQGTVLTVSTCEMEKVSGLWMMIFCVISELLPQLSVMV